VFVFCEIKPVPIIIGARAPQKFKTTQHSNYPRTQLRGTRTPLSRRRHKIAFGSRLHAQLVVTATPCAHARSASAREVEVNEERRIISTAVSRSWPLASRASHA